MTKLKATLITVMIAGAAMLVSTRAGAVDDWDGYLNTLRTEIGKLGSPNYSKLQPLTKPLEEAKRAAAELEKIANQPPEEIARSDRGRVVGGEGAHTAGWYCQRVGEAVQELEKRPNEPKQLGERVAPALQRAPHEFPPQSTERLAGNMKSIKEILTRLADIKPLQDDAAKVKQALDDPGLKEGLRGLEGVEDAKKTATKNVTDQDGKLNALQGALNNVIKMWNDDKQRLHEVAEDSMHNAPNKTRQDQFWNLVGVIDRLKLPAKVDEATALLSRAGKLRDNANYKVNQAFDQARQEAKDCEKVKDLTKIKQRAEKARDEYASNLEKITELYLKRATEQAQRVKKAEELIKEAQRKQETNKGDYNFQQSLTSFIQRTEQDKQNEQRELSLLKELADGKVGKAATTVRQIKF